MGKFEVLRWRVTRGMRLIDSARQVHHSRIDEELSVSGVQEDVAGAPVRGQLTWMDSGSPYRECVHS